MSAENPDGTFDNEVGGIPSVVYNPTSGDTITLKWSERDLFVKTSGTLAALTVKMPLKVSRGDRVEIGCVNAITTLTVHDGLGNAITGAPTALTAGKAVVMKYIDKTNGWVPWSS